MEYVAISDVNCDFLFWFLNLVHSVYFGIIGIIDYDGTFTNNLQFFKIKNKQITVVWKFFLLVLFPKKVLWNVTVYFTIYTRWIYFYPEHEYYYCNEFAVENHCDHLLRSTWTPEIEAVWNLLNWLHNN